MRSSGRWEEGEPSASPKHQEMGPWMGNPSFTNTTGPEVGGTTSPKSEQRQCPSPQLHSYHPQLVPHPLLSGSILSQSPPSLPTWQSPYIHPRLLQFALRGTGGPHPHPPPAFRVLFGRLTTQTPGSHYFPLPQGLPSPSPAASGLGRGYF